MSKDTPAEELFKSPCVFFHGSVSINDLPAAYAPEVAFVGRSNVGKSSLLNALTEKQIARVSSQPGRTAQLNFFDLGKGKLVLTDMPGYGYARVSKAVKAAWHGLIFDYLRGRVVLKRVFFLLDARIEIKASDLAAMDILDQAAVVYQIILTKTDALSETACQAKLAEVQAALTKRAAAYPHILAVSAKTGQNIGALREEIFSLI